MKFILVSDVHATSKKPVGRKDDILKTFIKKFSFILDYARKHNASIIQAGDFFHSPRDWFVLESFIGLLKEYDDVRIFSIFGQHDMYMRSKTATNTLSVLDKIGCVKLLKNKPIKIKNPLNTEKIYIYGCSWGETIPKPYKKGVNILVIHSSISNREVYPGHDYTSPKYFMRKNKGWDLIVVGDTHRYFTAKTNNTLLVNTGPLLRLEANEYNMTHKPKIFIYDPSLRKITNELIVPHKRARKVLSERVSAHNKNMESMLKEFTDELKKNMGVDENCLPSGRNGLNSFSFVENLKSTMKDRERINIKTKLILQQIMEGKNEH